MYYSLEIQESAKEAQEGKIDTKSVNIEEIPQEIAQQQKEIEETSIQKSENKVTEPQIVEKPIGNSEGGGCLIATATYGSEMAPQVQLLREIRDNQLLSTESGISFMTGFNSLYYSFSPHIADLERESPIFKEMVKIGITSLLSTLSVMSFAETESEVVGYGVGVILMNLGMYVAAPVLLINPIKNKRKKN